MIVLAVLAPLALCVLACVVAPAVAARMRPPAAAASLTLVALTLSLVAGLLLCLAGWVAAVRLRPEVWPADWRVGTIRELVPVPLTVAVPAGVLGAALLLSAAGYAVRLWINARRAAAAANALPAVDGLAIVEDDAIHAYAVPGRDSRVVVSTGLLRSLTAPERRALLEHERSHLRHRHHLYARLANLAAAANPLLRPVARAVGVALERWADADAVRAVGDRTIVARALGTAALSASSLPRTALGAARSAVVERVRQLLEPPRTRRGVAALVVVMAAACWACAAVVVLHVYNAVEISETVGRR